MRTVVLDASVLVGCRFKDGHARQVLLHAEDVTSVAPPEIQREAERRIPRVAKRARVSPSEAREILRLLPAPVHEVSYEVILPCEVGATGMAERAGDPLDGPYGALALALHAPVGTYDEDPQQREKVRVIETSAYYPPGRRSRRSPCPSPPVP